MKKEYNNLTATTITTTTSTTITPTTSNKQKIEGQL